MKKLLFSGIVVVFVFVSLAYGEDNADEVSNWSFKGFFQQNLNQVSFTNWAAGGENSFASASNARLELDYKKDRIKWENYADLSYGIIKIQDTPMRKSTDKIDLLSKASRSISDRLSYSAILNFLSQFDKGYKFPNDSVVVSRFMAPGYLTIALGIDYKPFEFLSIFASPATGKFTFVLDDDLSAAGAFGVDPGEYVNPEFGALVRIEFRREVVTNVNVNSRIVLFNNITDSDVSNRKNTDVDWLTSINMPINQYLTATVGFHLLYDHDIKIPVFEEVNGEQVQVGARPTTQFMQQFGLGLVYNF